jgi:hypothetical protein
MPELSAELVTILMLGSVLVLVITGFPLAYIIGFIGIALGIFLWEEQVSQVLPARLPADGQPRPAGGAPFRLHGGDAGTLGNN